VDIPAGTLNNILRAAGLKPAVTEMRYLVIYEKSPTGWNAYSPDLPGLTAEGNTLDEVKELIRKAMELYLDGMRRQGDPIPKPSATTEYIKVDRHA
jgi:predicted RNase H-like HicB family nuclease